MTSPAAATEAMGPVQEAAAPEQTLREHAPLLRIGCLLTMCGGYLEAYAYMAHGHVFANAQTGNVVFFGLSVAAHDWPGALRHLVPVLAFTGGVMAAKLLGVRPEKHTYRATLICLTAELVVLCVLAALGTRFPAFWFVPVIAFAVALQITSFSELGPLTFNSAMTTGNLLNAIGGLFAWQHHRDARGRVRGVLASAVVLSFAAGACLGGVCTPRFPAAALLPCVLLVTMATALLWRERLRSLAQGQAS